MKHYKVIFKRAVLQRSYVIVQAETADDAAVQAERTFLPSEAQWEDAGSVTDTSDYDIQEIE